MEPASASLRSITHDIRNLLTAIRGHAELALRGLPAEDPAREDVAHVVVVAAAVFDLVDQLDGADRSRTHVPVSLDTSVRSMRRLLDALLPDSLEVELTTDADGAYVAIPKLRIERIVLNLALNARDAMVDGGKLTVRTAVTPAGQAQIIVSDSGPGFSTEALEHLFEDGFTTKRDRGGTGHGLYALSAFVQAAGGSIEVQSTGEGATVTVSLPLIDLEAATAHDGDRVRSSVETGPTADDGSAPNADEGVRPDADDGPTVEPVSGGNGQPSPPRPE